MTTRTRLSSRITLAYQIFWIPFTAVAWFFCVNMTFAKPRFGALVIALLFTAATPLAIHGHLRLQTVRCGGRGVLVSRLFKSAEIPYSRIVEVKDPYGKRQTMTVRLDSDPPEKPSIEILPYRSYFRPRSDPHPAGKYLRERAGLI
jgi:hypothetical protein